MAAKGGCEMAVIIYSQTRLGYIREERASEPARSGLLHPLFFEL